MSQTPIYDALLAERGHPPVCAVCGDYALHLSAAIDTGIGYAAETFDAVFGSGLGAVLQRVSADAKHDLIEIAIGGPR